MLEKFLELKLIISISTKTFQPQEATKIILLNNYKVEFQCLSLGLVLNI